MSPLVVKKMAEVRLVNCQCMTDEHFTQIAKAHIQCLPESLLSDIGVRFVKAFYRAACQSDQEHLIARFENDVLAGVAFVSLNADSLTSRLMTPRMYISLAFSMLIPSIASRVVKTFMASSEDSNVPELVFFFSTPEFRGKGIGKRLLCDVVEALQERSLDTYAIKTLDSPDNQAIEFYSRNGFERQKSFSHAGHQYVYMTTKITDRNT